MSSGFMAESSRLSAAVYSRVNPYLINKTLHFYKYDTHTYFDPCSSTYIDWKHTQTQSVIALYFA